MPESINKSSEKNVRRKSGKKLSRLRSKKYEKSESEDESEKNFRYKTYSNLNDLLENESDKSMDKSSSKESDSFCVNKPPSNFDQDYFFEINRIFSLTIRYPYANISLVPKRIPSLRDDADVAQSVERRLGKAEVTGPIPVISLKIKRHGS